MNWRENKRSLCAVYMYLHHCAKYSRNPDGTELVHLLLAHKHLYEAYCILYVCYAQTSDLDNPRIVPHAHTSHSIFAQAILELSALHIYSSGQNKFDVPKRCHR